MKIFFKFLGSAFCEFFLHQYLSIRLFIENVLKAFYHPNKQSKDCSKRCEFRERVSAQPIYITGAPIKKKRKHRGGRKHRRKRFNNKPTK